MFTATDSKYKIQNPQDYCSALIPYSISKYVFDLNIKSVFTQCWFLCTHQSISHSSLRNFGNRSIPYNMLFFPKTMFLKDKMDFSSLIISNGFTDHWPTCLWKPSVDNFPFVFCVYVCCSLWICKDDNHEIEKNSTWAAPGFHPTYSISFHSTNLKINGTSLPKRDAWCSAFNWHSDPVLIRVYTIVYVL